MNLFQTLWTVLTTSNEGLIGIIFNDFGFPFIYIEAIVTSLLFTQIMNIKYTKKQFITYVLVMSTVSGLINTLLGKPYCSFLNMFTGIFLIMFIFKVNLFKGILSEFIAVSIIVVLETIFGKFVTSIFSIPFEESYLIPLSRLSITFLIYLSIYLIYRLIKYYKVNIKYTENMSKKNKWILILNFVFAIIAIGMQIYMIVFYVYKLPIFVTLLSILSLIIYASISIFSLLKTNKLEETSQSLEEAQLYNKTLQLLHDNLRTFKHDFSNTMQSIQGYIANNDMKGLEKYYQGIHNECTISNNLTALSPTLINDPALYSLIASKYLLAEQYDITFNISIRINFKELKIEPYVLTKILGILLDNAIDAAKLSDEKEILFEVNPPFTNSTVRKYVVSVQNTYSNKEVDVDRIREKGYTSKAEEEGSHGLGLWEVNKILKKSKNLNLYTTKNDKFFVQDLEIFDE